MSETEPRAALLPCPFCGYVGVSIDEGSTFRWRHVTCASCGAQCGEVRVQTMGEGTREQWEADVRIKALAEWNTRADHSPAPSAQEQPGNNADGQGLAQCEAGAIPSTGVANEGPIPSGTALFAALSAPVREQQSVAQPTDDDIARIVYAYEGAIREAEDDQDNGQAALDIARGDLLTLLQMAKRWADASVSAEARDKVIEKMLTAAWSYNRSPVNEYERGRYEAAMDADRAARALAGKR